MLEEQLLRRPSQNSMVTERNGREFHHQSISLVESLAEELGEN